MKQYSSIVVMFCFHIISFSQTNTFPSSGNAGVGTTSPSTIMELRATTPIITLSPSNYTNMYETTLGARSGAEAFLILGNNGQNEIRAGRSNSGGYLDFFTNNTVDQTQASNGNFAMRLAPNGKVGIGTTTPGLTLTVNGEIGIQESGSQKYHFDYYNGGLNIAESSVADYRFFIKDGGNVGIGTNNPQAKLAVNGDIFSKKVKVTQSGWADYVFNDNYLLMSLKELDDYIHLNKHLPEIPSAKEVEKNGLDLGDNQAVLLKKIEELTLYIIDQQKQIDELKKEIKDIKK